MDHRREEHGGRGADLGGRAGRGRSSGSRPRAGAARGRARRSRRLGSRARRGRGTLVVVLDERAQRGGAARCGSTGSESRIIWPPSCSRADGRARRGRRRRRSGPGPPGPRALPAPRTSGPPERRDGVGVGPEPGRGPPRREPAARDPAAPATSSSRRSTAASSGGATSTVASAGRTETATRRRPASSIPSPLPLAHGDELDRGEPADHPAGGCLDDLARSELGAGLEEPSAPRARVDEAEVLAVRLARRPQAPALGVRTHLGFVSSPDRELEPASCSWRSMAST